MQIYFTPEERRICFNILGMVFKHLNTNSKKDIRLFKQVQNKFGKPTHKTVLKKPEAEMLLQIFHQILEAREFKSEEEQEYFNSLSEDEKNIHAGYNTILLILMEKLNKKLGIENVQSN